MTESALVQSDIPGVPVRRGKVRDIYDFGDRLLFVATDRISAFDWVLPNGIPDKGRLLTQLSRMWFARLDVPHHLISMDLADVPLPPGIDHKPLEGRSMVVRKTEVVPIECVIRGYIVGSGWKDYQKTGSVCGIKLGEGLQLCDKLPEPIFTPATKAEEGHDMNISFEQMCETVGGNLAGKLRDLSLQIYTTGADYARERGIVIADTKFEFGRVAEAASFRTDAGSVGHVAEAASFRTDAGSVGHEGDEILLIDEVLTPDSSRFWPEDQYEPGKNQPSFDKQFVRDWLETTSWDKNSPPPTLPDEIVAKTREKYVEAFERLSGEKFAWA